MEEDNSISMSEDNTTIRFGLFLFSKAVEEVKELEPMDDSLEKILRLNLAVVHLMNAMELLLKAILQGKGRDIFNSKGETLNFFECLTGFTRHVMGINIQNTRDPLPVELLSTKNLYSIRNEIVHIGNQLSHHSILPLFRDCLQFYRDQIGIYFPYYEQETNTILSETPEEFYILDELPIYERYYRRYRHYLNTGDLEIALYSLFVAIEAIVRAYADLKSIDLTSKRVISFTRMVFEIIKSEPDFKKFQNNFFILRSFRNKASHGYGLGEEDKDAIIKTLNENDVVYNQIKDEINKERNNEE